MHRFLVISLFSILLANCRVPTPEVKPSPTAPAPTPAVAATAGTAKPNTRTAAQKLYDDNKLKIVEKLLKMCADGVAPEHEDSPCSAFYLLDLDTWSSQSTAKKSFERGLTPEQILGYQIRFFQAAKKACLTSEKVREECAVAEHYCHNHKQANEWKRVSGVSVSPEECAQFDAKRPTVCSQQSPYGCDDPTLQSRCNRNHEAWPCIAMAINTSAEEGSSYYRKGLQYSARLCTDIKNSTCERIWLYAMTCSLNDADLNKDIQQDVVARFHGRCLRGVVEACEISYSNHPDAARRQDALTQLAKLCKAADSKNEESLQACALLYHAEAKVEALTKIGDACNEGSTNACAMAFGFYSPAYKFAPLQKLIDGCLNEGKVQACFATLAENPTLHSGIIGRDYHGGEHKYLNWMNVKTMDDDDSDTTLQKAYQIGGEGVQ